MSVWRRLAAAVERAPVLWLLAGLVGLQTLLHARYLGLPPMGFHTWRQTQTLAVARNLHDEDFDLMRPRVDARGPGPGYAGMEFPLVNGAVALGYRVFGFHHGLHRVVLLLLSFPAVLGMFMLGRALIGSQAAGATAALFLVLNPLFAYYSICALPDAPMLAFLLPGLAWLVDWSRSSRTAPLLLGTAALAVAGLMKLAAGTAAPAAAWLFVRGLRRASGRQRVVAALALALGLIAAVGWYGWARYLAQTYGIREFTLGTLLPYPLATVPGLVATVLVRWLPEVYVSYPQFALVLVGAFALRRSGLSTLSIVLAGWGLGMLAYVVAFLPRLEIHDYYMTPVVPPLVLLAVVGLRRMVGTTPARRGLVWAIGALLVAAAIVGPYRGLSRFETARPDADLLGLERALETLIPDPRALVVAASDRSPSIYLYFMRRKGWSVEQGVEPERFRSMLSAGARYLISDSRALEARPDVAQSLVPLGRAGRFRVFALDARGSRSRPGAPADSAGAISDPPTQAPERARVRGAGGAGPGE